MLIAKLASPLGALLTSIFLIYFSLTSIIFFMSIIIIITAIIYKIMIKKFITA